MMAESHYGVVEDGGRKEETAQPELHDGSPSLVAQQAGPGFESPEVADHHPIEPQPHGCQFPAKSLSQQSPPELATCESITLGTESEILALIRDAFAKLLDEDTTVEAVLVTGVMVQLRLRNFSAWFDVRVHMFFDVSEPVIHNHARPFASLLLYGTYLHTIWVITETPEGDLVAWERRQGQGGGFDLVPNRTATASEKDKYIREVGSTLFHGRETYHTVESVKQEDKDHAAAQKFAAITLVVRPKTRCDSCKSEKKPCEECAQKDGKAIMWQPRQHCKPPNEPDVVLSDQEAQERLATVRDILKGKPTTEGTGKHYYHP